jgi:hypothetical protein
LPNGAFAASSHAADGNRREDDLLAGSTVARGHHFRIARWQWLCQIAGARAAAKVRPWKTGDESPAGDSSASTLGSTSFGAPSKAGTETRRRAIASEALVKNVSTRPSCRLAPLLQPGVAIARERLGKTTSENGAGSAFFLVLHDGVIDGKTTSENGAGSA